MALTVTKPVARSNLNLAVVKLSEPGVRWVFGLMREGPAQVLRSWLVV